MNNKFIYIYHSYKTSQNLGGNNHPKNGFPFFRGSFVKVPLMSSNCFESKLFFLGFHNVVFSLHDVDNKYMLKNSYVFDICSIFHFSLFFKSHLEI